MMRAVSRVAALIIDVMGLVLFAAVPRLSGDAPAQPAASNWPNWRGPGGQGCSDDTRVPLTWSESTNLAWKTPLPGHGNSSPIVWGDRIFLTAASNGGRERWLMCIRAGDGKMLWQ